MLIIVMFLLNTILKLTAEAAMRAVFAWE